MWNANDPILSNAQVYRRIAIEALERAHRAAAGAVDGGVAADPDHTALTDALTAIVFSYVATEALLWIAGCTKLGVSTYSAVDSDLLENRLKALGVNDGALLTDAARFRKLRKSLVHEKARLMGQGRSALTLANEEAGVMVDIMKRIERAVGVHADS